MEEVPVEIFNIILDALPRSQIRALRLVSRAIEERVAGHYFRDVVVPFQPKLYSTPCPQQSRDPRHVSLSLKGSDACVFQRYGHHVRDFSLSFQLDPNVLACPPLKTPYEAVSSFWGIYRWPHSEYLRYADVEALEMTADDTDGMREAFACLTGVSAVGLDCDAGLGFLLEIRDSLGHITSPDDSDASSQDGLDWSDELDRFVESNSSATYSTAQVVDNIIAFPHKSRADTSGHLLARMLLDAGYNGATLCDATRLLLETQATSPLSTSKSLNPKDIDVKIENGSATLPHLASREVGRKKSIVKSKAARGAALIPNKLTDAQKELLLELEWAHRALIQSFIISLVDGAGNGLFTNLTTLNIRQIPSCHVPIFHRKDIWSSIPYLRHVSLGVLADWRRITKPGLICDTPTSPAQAGHCVFELLHTYIGPQSNIESLHFEWVCGGEFARSADQRNQFVLPAPFFADPSVMVSPKETDQVLRLPSVKHLSLKNCWFCPHALIIALHHMALSTLETLNLESVSLTAPPATEIQPPPHMPTLDQARMQNTAEDLEALNSNEDIVLTSDTQTMKAVQAAAGIPRDDVAALVGQPPFHTVITPPLFSWGGILNHFAPIGSLNPPYADVLPSDLLQDAYMRAAMYLVPASVSASDRYSYLLRSITLKSCGYAIVDHVNIRNHAIVVTRQDRQLLYYQAWRHGMQDCRDSLCGKIYRRIQAWERHFLQKMFLMKFGWGGIYDENVVQAAKDDGFGVPGAGRFSGKVCAAVHDGSAQANNDMTLD